MTRNARLRLYVLALAALSALPAAAQLRPVGPEFLLGSSSSSVNWRVAPYGYGNFLVLLGGGGWTRPITMQRYDAAGQARGTPVLIVPPAIDPIYASAFAVSPSGEYLVAWKQVDMGFCAQWYVMLAPDDTLLADEQLDPPYQCGKAVVTAAGNGDFVLAHTRPKGFDVRVHDRAGTLIAAPFVVSESGFNPALVADRDGNFWVTWSEPITPSSSTRWSRRFDRWGHPLTEPRSGSSVGTPCHSGDMVRVSPLIGDDGRHALHVTFLRADGTPGATEYTVALDVPATPDTMLWPEPPACDAANNLVVPLTIGDELGDVTNVYAVRLRPDGTRDGPVFHVSSRPPDGHTSCAAITGDAGGNVLIAWESMLGAVARVFRVPPQGDFDADLGTDLVLRDPDTGATRLWMMDEGVRTGNVVVWPATPGPDWRLAAVDDFDGDRRQDLVFQNDASGEVVFALLGGPDGNEVIGAGPLAGAPGPQWELAGAGDFSHDGWPDLLWRQRFTQQLVVWTMQRTAHVGALVPSPDHAESGDWSVVSTADWNGDGMRDIAWSNRGTGRVVQWLLDGNLARLEGRFTNPAAPSDSSWRVVASGDFGLGPGGRPASPDLVWRNDASGNQVIWFFDFDGNRTAGLLTTPAAPNAPWHAVGPR